MPEIKILKPAGEAKVRRPDGKHLATAGERVEMTSYWVRRLAAGEVIEVKQPAPAAGKKTGGNE